MFWRHKPELLLVPRQHLNAKILGLVRQYRMAIATSEQVFSPTPISHVRGYIRICSLADLPTPLPHHMCNEDSVNTQHQVQVSYVIIAPDDATQLAMAAHGTDSSPAVLVNALEEGKRGQDYFLRDTLPSSMSFIRKELDQNRVVIVACKTGKDASVGVALAAIVKFFDPQGHLTLGAVAPPSESHCMCENGDG